MARAIAQLLPVEMAVLGLFEFALSFALIFVMLTAGGPSILLDSTNLSRDCAVLAGMLAVTIAATAITIGLYRPEVCFDRRRFLSSATIAALLAFPAILLVGAAYHMTLSGGYVVWLAAVMTAWLLFVMAIRYAVSLIAPYMPVTRRVLILGSGPRAARLRGRLAAKSQVLYEPVTYDAQTALASGLSAGFLRDRRVWGIVIAGDERDAPGSDGVLSQRTTNDVLLDSKLRGVPVYSDIAFQERHLGRVDLDGVDSNWLLLSDGFKTSGLGRGFKRVCDIFIGVILTIATLPLMLLTAAAIKLDSPGPVLYRQVRTGLLGKSFILFKFRSMTANAEAGGKAIWAEKRDPRVTRVGRFIRATRIDELPQLLNVMRGEMSMIGPRPERPIFVEQLVQVIPFYNHRSYVKPGLTGWAQVNFPYGASIEDAREKLAYDLYYVKNRGLLLDFIILLSTVRVILFREGAR